MDITLYFDKGSKRILNALSFKGDNELIEIRYTDFGSGIYTARFMLQDIQHISISNRSEDK